MRRLIQKLVESQVNAIFQVADAEAHKELDRCKFAAQSMANLLQKPVVLLDRDSNATTFKPEKVLPKNWA